MVRKKKKPEGYEKIGSIVAVVGTIVILYILLAEAFFYFNHVIVLNGNTMRRLWLPAF
jgi:hypothetical protein